MTTNQEDHVGQPFSSMMILEEELGDDRQPEHGNEKTTVYCIHRQGRWARTRDQACRTKEAEKSPEVLLSVNLSEASGNIRDTFFEASDLGPNF